MKPTHDMTDAELRAAIAEMLGYKIVENKEKQ